MPASGPPSNLPKRQHSPQGDSSAAFGIYVCPKCKGALASNHESLSCESCRVTYPIVEGIPDFVLGDLTQSAHPMLRRLKGFERLAPIYETKQWCPLVLNLYGGLGSTSLEELRQKIAEIVDIEKGLILDVAWSSRSPSLKNTWWKPASRAFDPRSMGPYWCSVRASGRANAD